MADHKKSKSISNAPGRKTSYEYNSSNSKVLGDHSESKSNVMRIDQIEESHYNANMFPDTDKQLTASFNKEELHKLFGTSREVEKKRDNQNT